MKIRCPSCRTKAEIQDEELFEVRGQWRNRPVRKCLTCGRGLRLPLAGPTQLVPAELWERMEASWEREFGPRV